MSEQDEQRQDETPDVEGHKVFNDPVEKVSNRDESEDDTPDVEGHLKGRAHKGRAHKGRA